MKQYTFYAIVMVMFIILMSLNSVAQQDSTALQTILNDTEVGGQWIYGDLSKGITLAQESGKPLFVLFR